MRRMKILAILALFLVLYSAPTGPTLLMASLVGGWVVNA